LLAALALSILAGVTGLGTRDSRDTAYTARTSTPNRSDWPTGEPSKPVRLRWLVLAWQDGVYAHRRMREIGLAGPSTDARDGVEITRPTR
jgi:hypothetical protein